MMSYNEKQIAENVSTAGAKMEKYVAENIDAIWEQVKGYCQKRMPKGLYDLFISDLKVVSVVRYMTITLEVYDKSSLALVALRYRKKLEEAFESVLGTAVHLQLEAASEAEYNKPMRESWYESLKEGKRKP